ncbi:hypothetical protein FRC12_005460 [Ceratobasidium sp. 428]|nr:hypothetical protein FRC12_005460 [Ceratobasidium sp. 428]
MEHTFIALLAPYTRPSDLVVRSRLNYDVLVKISEYLETPGDRLSLALASRWHHFALGHTVYMHLSLWEMTKIDSLVRALLANEGWCSAIIYMTVLFPPSHTTARCTRGHYVSKESYYARRQNLTEGVFVILKLASRLRFLSMSRFGEDSYVQSNMINTWLRGPYSFQLKSLALEASQGTLAFLKHQHQLVHLTLWPGAEYTELSQLSRLPIRLPHLQTLWATPWWCSLILPYSSVQHIGLLSDDPTVDEDATWKDYLDDLIAAGGYSAATSIALEYRELFRDREHTDLPKYGKAFPSITRLGVRLPLMASICIESLEETLDCAKILVKRYADSLLPTVNELVFLRPQDIGLGSYVEQHQIVQIAGDYREDELLNTLQALLPSLKHIDLAKTCYRRAAKENAWHSCPRICSY